MPHPLHVDDADVGLFAHLKALPNVLVLGNHRRALSACVDNCCCRPDRLPRRTLMSMLLDDVILELATICRDMR